MFAATLLASLFYAGSLVLGGLLSPADAFNESMIGHKLRTFAEMRGFTRNTDDFPKPSSQGLVL